MVAPGSTIFSPSNNGWSFYCISRDQWRLCDVTNPEAWQPIRIEKDSVVNRRTSAPDHIGRVLLLSCFLRLSLSCFLRLVFALSHATCCIPGLSDKPFQKTQIVVLLWFLPGNPPWRYSTPCPLGASAGEVRIDYLLPEHQCFLSCRALHWSSCLWYGQSGESKPYILPNFAKNRGRNKTISSFVLKYGGRNHTNFSEIWKREYLHRVSTLLGLLRHSRLPLFLLSFSCLHRPAPFLV